MSEVVYHQVRIMAIQSNSNEYWDWCSKHLAFDTWKMMTGFTGRSATFCFVNEEDLLAFKLKFNV